MGVSTCIKPVLAVLLAFLLASPAGMTARGQSTDTRPRERVITGVVTDERGVPLAGAHVLVVGRANTGTATGADGKFTLAVAPGSSLRVVFVGFEEKTVVVGEPAYYFIRLAERVAEIEEVLVVGYGVQRKESVVGAISQVKGEELVRAGQTTITNALAGKLSGVATIQRSGMPGNDHAEIVIRGLSSFDSSSPLVLVDGVERDFTSIDPHEVSTVSVLKDASATAVFGARGANGVIIVTTKRGTEGRPRMDFSFSAGVQLPINVARHVDAYATMSLLNVARMNDKQFSDLTPAAVLQEYARPSSRLNAIRYPDVDWFEELTEPYAPSLNANFNVRGGTRFVKYFAAVGYAHQGSLFKSWQEGKFDTRFYYNRVNYRANLDFNLTGATTLSFNLGGNVGIQNKPVPRDNDATLWKFVFGASTTKSPMYYPAWVMEEVPDPDYPGLTEDRLIDNMGDVTYNPYFVLAGGKFNQYTDSKLFSDILLEQRLDFITPGLSAKGKFSLSTYYKYNSLSTQYTQASYILNFSKVGSGVNPWERAGSTNEVYTPNPSYTTVGGLSDGYYHDLYYDLSLNYARSFGRHAVTGLLLLNRQEADKGTAFTYYNEAVVGRVTYDYAHKYLVEVNMGYTGSERFAPGNRFGFFPSGAVGWIASEEAFFKRVLPWVDKFKARVSWGLVGSDYARNRWLYVSEFSKDANGNIKEDPSANTVAQWEEARKRDVGIELAILENRLTATLDLFDESRYKMLIPVNNTVPMWVGNSYKDLNKGRIKKHGLEVEMEWRARVSEDFSYHARGNFGFNENRILYQDDAPYALSHQKKTGTAIGAQSKGAYLTGNGFYTSVDDIHSHASALPDIGELVVGDYKFLDYMPDGLINRDDLTRIKGSTQPPIGYAFGGGIRWRGLDVSFLFQGYAGKYVNFDQMYEYEFYKGNYRVHVSQADYWSPGNPGGNHAALHYTAGWISNLYWSGIDESETNAGYAAKIAGKSWRRADFLRLKEVYIAYSMESARLKTLTGIRHVRVYATGNNLLTFTSLLEGDPENTYLLYGNYPQMMTIKGGLEISF
jgi:TonB-linked SusC/RagA family outer membrane protein